MRKHALALSLAALIITSFLLIGYYIQSMLRPEALVFLAYAPYWFEYFRGNNWTDVARDLDLIKYMGFDGVRIHYEYVVKYDLVERLLNCTRDLDLKVIWATHATY